MDPIVLWLLMVTTSVTLQISPADTVTLLPSPDGRESAVFITGKSGTLEVNEPFHLAKVRADGVMEKEKTTLEEVRKRHPELYSLMPKAEVRYVLQFKTGSTVLTPESQALLEEVLNTVRQIEGGEAVVVGHTDRVGNPRDNEVLSLERANSVRRLLLDAGMASDLVTAVGRGEREPVVPTEPGVAEPKNRRVEILVR